MKLLDNIKNKTLIICSNKAKKSILNEINNYNKLFNIKFLTKEEFYKYTYFDYDKNTVYYLMNKLNIKYDIATSYLNNLIYLNDTKCDNIKINFLSSIKSDIDNLLIYNKDMRNYINTFDIVVYNYTVDKFFKRTLNMYNKVDIYSDSNTYTHVVNHFNTMDEEIEYICQGICDLVCSGVDLNSIKLCCVDNTYEGCIKRIFDMYNIPINLYKTSIYETTACSYFLSHYSSDLTGVVDYLVNNFDNNVTSEIIKIINKYTFEVDKNKVYDMIVADLKSSYISNIKYEKCVDIISIDDISNNDYVFIANFNEGSVPKTYKDEDFLSDCELELLGLETTVEKNILEKDKIINILKNNKNIFISYKDKDNIKAYYPSSLIRILNMEVKSPSISFNYSNKYNKYKLCLMLDDYYKYGINNEDMYSLYSTYNVKYKEYDNRFSGIDFNNLNKILNNNLTLSYTALEKYNECAFKYYINNILKLDTYEDTFSTFIGTLFHHVLEKCLTSDDNIDTEIDNFISDKEFNDRELFYINKLKPDIKTSIDTIKEQMKFSKFNDYKFENKLCVYKEGKLSVTFKGFIDKMLFYKDNGNEYITIIDYKTNDTDIKLDLLKYGLNIQLPIYLYLVSKNYKDACIVGFYVQRVLPSINKYDYKKCLVDRKKDEMKLLGYSNYDASVISILDYGYKDSNVVKGLRVNNDGSYSSYAKVLTKDGMDKIINEVDKVIDSTIDNISNCNFTINPKNYNNTNISCAYCKYRDLCFVREDDVVYIEEGESND